MIRRFRVYLQPQSHLGSQHLVVRPLARKDIFYSGSIYQLNIDTTTDNDAERHNRDAKRHSISSTHRVTKVTS